MSSGLHRALTTGHRPHGEWSRLQSLPYLLVVKQFKGLESVPIQVSQWGGSDLHQLKYGLANF